MNCLSGTKDEPGLQEGSDEVCHSGNNHQEDCQDGKQHVDELGDDASQVGILNTFY